MSPAFVSFRPVLVLIKRGIPILASSRLRDWLKADWETPTLSLDLDRFNVFDISIKKVRSWDEGSIHFPYNKFGDR